MIHGTITGYTRHACRCEHCAQAGRDWREKRKARRNAIPRLPVEMIYPHVKGADRRRQMAALQRYAKQGIPIYKADIWCCRLGLHPWFVFGDLYFQDLWEAEQHA